jgi:site-specific DNA-methyltransferase (adenine-specific)
VDLVLTDPPYGIGWQSNWRADTFKPIIGDLVVDASWLKLVDSKIIYLFSRWDVMQRWLDGLQGVGLIPRDVLIWDKKAHGAGDLSSWAPCYEMVLYATRGRVELIGPRPQNVLRHWRVDAGATGASSGRMLCHPAEKPIPLLAEILSKHAALLILDPFMGSGTTLVAAKQLGRRAIGIEIEEKYCAIAVDRLRQSVLDFGPPRPATDEQMALLESSSEPPEGTDGEFTGPREKGILQVG